LFVVFVFFVFGVGVDVGGGDIVVVENWTVYAGTYNSVGK
jgi:hypothetical protein